MSIEANKIFYSGLYSDYISIEHKDENILYFCTDTKKLFKGEIDMTEQVIFDLYRPSNPVSNKIYVFSGSGTIEYYDGTNWNVLDYPIQGTNNVVDQSLPVGSTSVTFDTVVGDDITVDFYTDNNAQYVSIDNTSVDGKTTVTYLAQETNDVVHMRTYDNTKYHTRMVSSLCLDSITITKQPDTVIYGVGDPVDLTGIEVTATMDTTTYNVTNYIESIPPVGTPVSANTNNIKVLFGAQQASFNISTVDFNEIEVTTLPTRTSYLIGDNLDLTGIVVTAYANNKTVSKIITDKCTFTPNNGTVLNSDQYSSVQVSYNNIQTSFNIVVNVPPSNMENASWEMIGTLVRRGIIGDYYQEGSKKSLTITLPQSGTTQTFNMVLARINQGENKNGSLYPLNTVDFISDIPAKESVKYIINGAPSYALESWPRSTYSGDIRQYLNNNIYQQLSTELQNQIVPKVHAYLTGDLSGREVVSDNLWLPEVYELTGYSRGGNYPDNTYNVYYNNYIKYIGSGPFYPYDAIWTPTAGDKTGTVYEVSYPRLYYSASVKCAGVVTTRSYPIAFRIG